MAIHKSVLKRERQTDVARLRNRIIKSKVHTAKLRLEQAIISKDKEDSYARLSTFMSEVDKSVKRGIFQRNKGARLKSRATKKVKIAFNEMLVK
ncbi:MAG: 30S ribosomal protein S20 [Spirochaetes bacterium GWF1_31_7]|nr:MAG: 30S ribosomal protein S20 [Spirochaetes bacterium GWE1_32_154]OHD49125.1 MAG: 30S ribosomal protein S20 [Spirochaetes bacterium GWF1_31_7]OHD50289.1 MAG: 30S ribosomal protein S20 [Spirochaetes bacterium GWE2_31_10]OHD82868.1 MAG: 30S ribosomal protein S20 [Spirochaetes bacterium RIFOXYB1_FULL_32_8]HBD93925.1 30S ribosomal protein S20 [Spirochaetia bacterium]